jgi:hypothetical protein
MLNYFECGSPASRPLSRAAVSTGPGRNGRLVAFNYQRARDSEWFASIGHPTIGCLAPTPIRCLVQANTIGE